VVGRDDLIHAYRARHVLESLFAEVFDAGSRLVADLVVNIARDADAAGRGDRVDARRDVDAVAQHRVVREHHVAQMNPDAHLQFGLIVQRRLHLAGAVHRVDRAMEAAQRAVADLTDQAAVEFRQQGAQQFAMPVQGAQGLMLVAPPMIAV